MDFSSAIKSDPTHYVSQAVILVLLLVILYKVWYLSSSVKTTERLIGSGVVDQVFTSGATMRRLGQEFSGTNQGEYSIVHNDELKELLPSVARATSKERLVSERGEPDFWEISGELDAYRSRQASQMSADAAADAAAVSAATDAVTSTEYLSRDSVGSQVEDALLTNYLYR
jgi:hypothetical protein